MSTLTTATHAADQPIPSTSPPHPARAEVSAPATSQNARSRGRPRPGHHALSTTAVADMTAQNSLIPNCG